jgi:uncharacterized membrane protein YhiD involved in acid resistance
VSQFVRALEGSNRWFADYSFESILLSLLLAFVLGQLIAWIYAWSHSGLSYSRSFTQSLVLMTLVVSIVMYVIGNSIITAFGLLGALALIRFRNVLKDTRDTVFVFIALVVGMAVGSQRYMTAIVGTVALMLAVLYLNTTSFGTLGRFDGYLTCRLGGGIDRGEVSRLLQRFCRAVKPVSTRQSGDEEGAELVYQVGLRDRERGGELLDELQQLDGMRHVSLVLRNELSEV